MSSIDPIMVEMGYTPKTTFWNDFTMADAFGVSAIQDTFDRSFRDWKDNIEYLTELALVLNHKIWQHYETNESLASLYERLWRYVDDWCYDNLEEEDFDYYYWLTD